MDGNGDWCKSCRLAVTAGDAAARLPALKHLFFDNVYSGGSSHAMRPKRVGGLIVTQRVLAVVQRLSHCHI
jgi:hypothetical protein